jgi:CheY-like chemotaxis protein
MIADRRRILLAEDNPADAWLIQEALRRRSLTCDLDHYLTAEDAIRAVAAEGANGKPVPDLILLDFNLPGGQGLEVLAAATKNSRLGGVPKALVSSSLLPNEMSRAKQLGVTCFIGKPSNLKEFLEEVGSKIAGLLKVA